MTTENSRVVAPSVDIPWAHEQTVRRDGSSSIDAPRAPQEKTSGNLSNRRLIYRGRTRLEVETGYYPLDTSHRKHERRDPRDSSFLQYTPWTQAHTHKGRDRTATFLSIPPDFVIPHTRHTGGGTPTLQSTLISVGKEGAFSSVDPPDHGDGKSKPRSSHLLRGDRCDRHGTVSESALAGRWNGETCSRYDHYLCTCKMPHGIDREMNDVGFKGCVVNY